MVTRVTTVLCLTLVGAAALSTEPTDPGVIDGLCTRITGPDAKDRADAVLQVRSLVASQARSFGPQLIEALIKSGQFEALEALSVECLLVRSAETDAVALLARARMQALSGLGRHDDALAAAKSFYNVVPLKMTRQAIDAVALRLQQARGNDEPDLARTFRGQQKAGITAVAKRAGPSVLDSIHVDGAVYLKAVKRRGEGTHALKAIARGNLLLLADRPKDAREMFEAARAIARGRELTLALEGIARSIRAETGVVGPANAFILELQRGPATTQATPVP